MKPHLLLKKKLEKIVHDSRGFSAIIGTVFMVLVALLLCTNVFLWTLSQNTLYNEAVKERNQLEVDRLNERVKAFNAVYDWNDGEVSVSADLQNQGPLSVQITNLWVKDIDKDLYDCSGPLDVNLEPGGASTLEINVTIIGSESGDRFSSWLITGRGNVVPLQAREIKEITVAEVAAGIGAISMDFSNFKYYNVTEPGPPYFLENYAAGGKEGYVVSFSRDIAFQVNLTNYDVNIPPRDIVLSSGSLLWMLFPTLPNQPRCRWWYIVNVDDNGKIAATFTPVTLKHAQSKIVFFASAQDTSGGFIPSPSGASGGGSLKLPAPGVVNLMLVGNWAVGISNFGQNVPFVTIYVKP